MSRDINICRRKVWKIVEETDHAVKAKQVEEQVKRNVDTGSYRHREMVKKKEDWFFKDQRKDWPSKVTWAYNSGSDRYPYEKS